MKRWTGFLLASLITACNPEKEKGGENRLEEDAKLVNEIREKAFRFLGSGDYLGFARLEFTAVDKDSSCGIFSASIGKEDLQKTFAESLETLPQKIADEKDARRRDELFTQFSGSCAKRHWAIKKCRGEEAGNKVEQFWLKTSVDLMPAFEKGYHLGYLSNISRALDKFPIEPEKKEKFFKLAFQNMPDSVAKNAFTFLKAREPFFTGGNIPADLEVEKRPGQILLFKMFYPEEYWDPIASTIPEAKQAAVQIAIHGIFNGGVAALMRVHPEIDGVVLSIGMTRGAGNHVPLGYAKISRARLREFYDGNLGLPVFKENRPEGLISAQSWPELHRWAAQNNIDWGFN